MLYDEHQVESLSSPNQKPMMKLEFGHRDTHGETFFTQII
jgi:hypothetical protein